MNIPPSRTYLTYDDVQLIPKHSTVVSRLDVDLSVKLSNNNTLIYPVLSAPMDTITGPKMAEAMWHFGGLGIIHRFKSEEKRIEAANKAPCGVAIGLQDSIKFLGKLKKDHVVLFCLDVAHGDQLQVCDKAQEVKRAFPNTLLMVGNVATPEGAVGLAAYGADIVKVGVGSGSICSTRLVTGFGLPMVTCLMEIREKLKKFEKPPLIVADGGIRKGADISKALAAGADLVMFGSLLSGCEETPGKAKGGYKVYRGMASREVMADCGKDKKGIAAEGISTKVPVKGKVVHVLSELMGGLKSACTYVGAKNLKEFYNNTEFVQVTNAGIIEADTHILRK